MQPRITAVAFDLGGVLIDWNPRYLYRSLFDDDEAMERFLAEVCTPPWNASLDAGRPFADGVAELIAAHPDQAELIAAYQSRWVEMLGSAYEETVEIVREVKRAGYRTFALSNWSAETFPATRRRFPFLDEFDGVLISGQIGAIKPDPRIFGEFVTRFGLTPAETLFIDDWDRNVDGARACGLMAVQFYDAPRLRRDLRSLGLPIAEA